MNDSHEKPNTKLHEQFREFDYFDGIYISLLLTT